VSPGALAPGLTIHRFRVTITNVPLTGVIKRLRGVDYSASLTCFVTFAVMDRVRVFSSPIIAELAKNVVVEYRHAGWYRLFCYCIMPDHIHLLLRTNGRALSRIVGTLKNRIRYPAKGLGCRFAWQSGFHDRIRRAGETVDEYAEYILANPVRAGMVRVYTEYPYCGIVDYWK
jgi:putative transposase